MSTLSNKTLFITGASRGIGLEIALRAARDGANVVVAAKTSEPHPKLPGTIHSAVEAIEKAGGRGLACACDVRFEDQLASAVAEATRVFGGIDILVNNASAITLSSTTATEMKRFDLMHQVNVRGTFLASKLCIPQLKRSKNPHILVLSPPLNLDPRWVSAHLAYTLSKYGMSLCVLGLAQELRGDGIAVNALWPRTAIATAAVQNLLGGAEALRRARSPEIVADAAHQILTSNAREVTGNFFLDEDVLRSAGASDFDRYAQVPASELLPDFFV